MGLLKKLFAKPDMRIEFNQVLNDYTVTKANASILFVGNKEKCKDFLRSYGK